MCCGQRYNLSKYVERQDVVDEQASNKIAKEKPRMTLYDFQKSASSRLVLFYYTKPVPEIQTIEEVHKDVPGVNCFPHISRWNLFRSITKLGFVFKKGNSKMQIYHRFNFVVNRQKYLSWKKKFDLMVMFTSLKPGAMLHTVKKIFGHNFFVI